MVKIWRSKWWASIIGGTATDLTLVNPALGTPSSGDLRNTTTTTAASGDNGTTLANTAFVQQEIGININSKAHAQGVAMTAAASGSNGIQAAHAANYTNTTNSCGYTLRRKLTTWTPSANVILYQKLTGGAGVQIELVATTGVIRTTLNATVYNSAVPGGGAASNLAANTEHVIDVNIDVGATTTTISTYIDGNLVNTTAAQANVDLTNTATAYFDGTSATRSAVTDHQNIIFNCARTAAEVKDMYLNGIPEAWKWGSQTNLNSATLVNNGSSPYNTFSGATTAAFHAETDGTAGYHIASTTDAITFTANKKVIARFTLAITAMPASLTVVIAKDANLTAISGVSGRTITAADGAGYYEVSFTPTESTTGVVAWYHNTAQIVNYDVSGFEVVNGGATLAFEPGGIQPAGANSQWIGEDGTVATLPAAGATVTQRLDKGRYLWTTAMTDDTTWTSILPAGFELERVIFNNSTANTCTLRLGTSAGGTEMIASISIGAGGFTTALCNKPVSLTADTTLYLSDTGGGWGSCSLTATLLFRRIN